MTSTLKLPHMKRPCADCPFRKDTLKGWLGEKRMTSILEDSRFVCHKKTDMQCAGHMLIKGSDNDFVRLAGQMGIKLELSGRELIFDDSQACINHHDHEKREKRES